MATRPSHPWPPAAEPLTADVGRYVLQLVVAGKSPNSVRAIGNIKAICEARLPGRYALEVIDLYQQPQLAQGEQIVALPTLIKKWPLPLRRIVGDMSDSARVLAVLDLAGEM